LVSELSSSLFLKKNLPLDHQKMYFFVEEQKKGENLHNNVKEVPKDC
jgi:hypothetical protein